MREPIAVDVYVEDGLITHCSGYLGDREVSGAECIEPVMGAECLNCGAELMKLPPEKIIRNNRWSILSKELSVSDEVDSSSEVLKESVRAADIVLKGRMALFVKARIEDGLKALATLSANSAVAMLATVGEGRLVVVSRKGEVTAAYLKFAEDEFLGSEALNEAMHRFSNHAIIQIFSLPEELALTLTKGGNRKLMSEKPG